MISYFSCLCPDWYFKDIFNPFLPKANQFGKCVQHRKTYIVTLWGLCCVDEYVSVTAGISISWLYNAYLRMFVIPNRNILIFYEFGYNSVNAIKVFYTSAYFFICKIYVRIQKLPQTFANASVVCNIRWFCS